jgi:hypothetical protein
MNITVKVAEICKGTRNPRTRRTTGLDGCVITFDSSENIKIDSIVLVHIQEKDRYFEVKECSTTETDLLEFCAVGCGYYGDRADRIKDLDLRSLIGEDVIVLQDDDLIKCIRQSSAFT